MQIHEKALRFVNREIYWMNTTIQIPSHQVHPKCLMTKLCLGFTHWFSPFSINLRGFGRDRGQVWDGEFWGLHLSRPKERWDWWDVDWKRVMYVVKSCQIMSNHVKSIFSFVEHENLVGEIWVWVNTYRYIFSGMNIHLPAILGFTRYQGFEPSPYG